MGPLLIVGAGHVGLVHGAGFAKLGHEVRVLDSNTERVAALRRGEVPFHEPGLAEAIADAVRTHRLSFVDTYSPDVRATDLIFVCVQTPSGGDGSLDTGHVYSAVQSLRSVGLRPGSTVVCKSTVPPGTTRAIAKMLENDGVNVAVSPEFLAEGDALRGFFAPDRIVVGAESAVAAEATIAAYSGIRAEVVVTDFESAELAKLAANAFLAMKVSFANYIAGICEASGGRYLDVRRILAADRRIGSGHLGAGLGFGGPCLTKDLRALASLSSADTLGSSLLQAVLEINEGRPAEVTALLDVLLDGLSRRRVAVFGLAFKGGTDDISGSPSLRMIAALQAAGATVTAYDPIATASSAPGSDSPYSAAASADAVVLATDSPGFAGLDWSRIQQLMRGHVVLDTRPMGTAVVARGLSWHRVGERAEPDRGSKSSDDAEQRSATGS